MYPATCTTAVGVFSTRDEAEAAVDALYHAGFTSAEIGIVARDAAGSAKLTRATTEEAEDAGQGALVGAVAGAGVGGLIGAGVLAGVIPVIGPALFAGTLGVLASNAVGGAALAGIIGALTGWGIPEEHAKYYESEVVGGKTVVTVTSTRCDEARSILRSFGAVSKDPAWTNVSSN